MSQQQYYLYIHAYPKNHTKENQIFYVGKGCKKRYLNISNRSDYHKGILKKLIHEGFTIDNIAFIIKCNLYEEIAYQEETKLIKELGRKNNNTGTLVNMTRGGKGGTFDRTCKESTRKLKSENTKRQHKNNPRIPLEIKNQITELYKTDMSKNAIANKLNVSFYAVNDHIKKNGIKEKKDGRSVSHNKLDMPSKEILEELYLNQKLSFLEIGKMFNISNVTASKWINRLHITKRTHKENQTIQMPRAVKRNNRQSFLAV